jgi:hypothetical protein
MLLWLLNGFNYQEKHLFYACFRVTPSFSNNNVLLINKFILINIFLLFKLLLLSVQSFILLMNRRNFSFLRFKIEILREELLDRTTVENHYFFSKVNFISNIDKNFVGFFSLSPQNLVLFTLS